MKNHQPDQSEWSDRIGASRGGMWGKGEKRGLGGLKWRWKIGNLGDEESGGGKKKRTQPKKSPAMIVRSGRRYCDHTHSDNYMRLPKYLMGSVAATTTHAVMLCRGLLLLVLFCLRNFFPLRNTDLDPVRPCTLITLSPGSLAVIINYMDALFLICNFQSILTLFLFL